MKLRSVLLLCLAVIMTLPATVQAVPRTVITELASTTWCVYCPNAVAGLTVCEENFFDHSEFIWVEYMGSSGGLGCPGSELRLDYYGISSYPYMVWDGVVTQSGAPAEDVNGLNYQTIINNRLAEDSPLSVSVTSYKFYGGDSYITVEIEVFEELPSIADTYLRMGICNNDMNYQGQNYHNILVAMPDEIPLTIQHVGEIQEVTMPLNINGDWQLSELWAYVFVQRDSDKVIYNAGSTYVTPYALLVETDGGQSAIVDGSHTFGTTAITHTGAATSHTVDITLDTSRLPEGWDAYFTLDGLDLTFATVTLAQYEAANLAVTLVPGDTGFYGRAVMNLHSQSGEMPDAEVPFEGNRLGADLLIVGGDNGGRYADDYFAPAVEAAGYSYSVWDRSNSAIDGQIMRNYQTVIWYSGDIGPGLAESDRTEIEAYLASGGNMLFSGQNLAAETVADGASSWMINELRTFFLSNADSGPLVAGVAGDPVSEGLSLDLQGGDGAGNYFDPDVVNPFGSSAQSVSLFTYTDTDKSAGTRVEYDGYKHIFLGFGFESINAVADREALMANCLDWLIDPTSPVEGGLLPVMALYQNLPNPFNPQTTIAFDLPGQMAVSLYVYDISGRLVDVLLNNEVGQQGRNEVVWRGKDAAGRALPSGTYFYRIEGQDFGDTKRMTLLK